MAILFFYINKEKGDKVEVKLDKHEGEKESDLSYKWGEYAIQKAIELNFENIFINPYVVDQGAKIHFLSGNIMRNNKINAYGHPIDENYDTELIDEEDGFNEYRTTFEPNSVDEAADVIIDDDAYVHIVLDMNDASKYIGGFNAPTALSAGAVYNSTKEHAEELASGDDILY